MDFKKISIITLVVAGFIIYKGGGPQLAHAISHMLSQLGKFVNSL